MLGSPAPGSRGEEAASRFSRDGLLLPHTLTYARARPLLSCCEGAASARNTLTPGNARLAPNLWHLEKGCRDCIALPQEQLSLSPQPDLP